MQLVLHSGIQLVCFLFYLEVELQYLLCHIFFLEVTVIFQVDKLVLKHATFKLHASIGNFLLILFGLAELILKTKSHIKEGVLAGRAKSIDTLSIFGQLREHFGFPFGKRVFKFGNMPLELSDFLIKASEKSVFDGCPGIM